MLIEQSLTERIVGLAIEVHRNTGRGLLESVYERCLCYELQRVGLPFERQVGIPVTYKGLTSTKAFALISSSIAKSFLRSKRWRRSFRHTKPNCRLICA